ncbi:unnamed protein product [Clonostachys chloroleuca]|uniref:Uncharacterized protein n=1 Tax=Clonostachys chloroleuca TaxID=1926264 RepID=A0AA35QD36_9HYPO|nr:unnamed protein product [Clonostachys chloroleuca]
MDDGVDESVLKDLWIDNDQGPFKSSSYTLVFGGPGRKSVRIDTGDRDIITCVSADETATRLLHLRNVRDDTVEEAKAAITQLLDELKSQDESRDERHLRPGYLKVEHVNDKSHEASGSFFSQKPRSAALELLGMKEGIRAGCSEVSIISCGSKSVKNRGTSETSGNDSHQDV